MTVSCPYITGANIAVSGAGFSLYSIKWQYEPLGEQSVLVQYRVQGDVTWINVSTSLKVDAFGNILTGSLTILNSAVQNETYEVRLVNQCGSLEYIQTFTYPVNIFSDMYLLGNAVYNICGNTPTVLYSFAAFGVGVVLYEDIQLSIPITGYLFISSLSTGEIYNLDAGTGEVGVDTTYNCNGTITTNGKVSNNPTTICSNSIISVYSNSVLTSGVFIYSDIALSIPLTGYDYFVIIGNSTIYTLNNLTGEITGIYGGGCTAYGNFYSYSKVKEDLPNEPLTQLYTSGSFGKGAVMFTDYALTTALTGFNFISLDGSIRDISSTTGTVGCLSTNC